MSEQTAQGRAQAAEARGKAQMREQIRAEFAAMLRDPEKRAELLRSPEFAEVVRAEQLGQFNDILRQAREQRLAEQIERQAERRAKAPKQVTSSNSHGDPFSRDLEHTDTFMRAIKAGKTRPQALELARQAHPVSGRPRLPREGDANAFRHKTESPGVLWDTRNGPLKAGSSAHQAPHVAEPEPDYMRAGPPADTAASALPGDRNSPLNRGI